MLESVDNSRLGSGRANSLTSSIHSDVLAKYPPQLKRRVLNKYF